MYICIVLTLACKTVVGGARITCELGVRYLENMARFSKVLFFLGLLLMIHAAYSAVQRESNFGIFSAQLSMSCAGDRSLVSETSGGRIRGTSK